jgi:hypothetical protein
MVRLARGLWPIIAVVAIAGGTVWLMYAVWRSPHRNDLASFGSYAAAIAVIAGGLITRERNVFRTVGPVYQFRHARLQDRLAEQQFPVGENFGTRRKPK